MQKHLELLQQNNLAYEKLSKGLKSKIDEFNQFYNSYQNAQKLADEGDTEAADDAAEFEKILNQLDSKLVSSLEKYIKNMPMYAELGENLKRGMQQRKLAKEQNQQNQQTQQHQQQPQPNQQSQQTQNLQQNQKPTQKNAQNANQNQQVTTEDKNKTPKKISKIWGVIGGILVAGVTVYFGVPVVRNWSPFKK